MADRRRKKNPKKNQMCLRLTDRQLELLGRYAQHRGFNTGVDAVRHMIDGLEDWLARQESRRSITDVTAAQKVDSGLPSKPSDVTRSDGGRGDVTRGDGGDGGPSVSDFGGRPSVGLPDPSWNQGISDE